MTKIKRGSSIGKIVKYALSSAGKGASESFRIFKRIKTEHTTPVPKNEESFEKSSPGKIANHPSSFQEFEIKKKVAGNYEMFSKKLFEDSKIILIFGKRGSGKSALGLRTMENIQAKTKRKCYTLGIAERFLPSWIESVSTIDEAEEESIILVDEGAVSFSSRESMRKINKELSKIMAIARHKNLTIIMITQNTGMIDKNVLKLADSLLIKEGSLLQQEMERSEIKKLYEKAKEFIDKEESDKIKYFYLIDSDFEGLLTYTIPSFWSNQLSKNKASSSLP